MDALLRFDTVLFTFINHLPHTNITDTLALAISGVGTAGIIWFILATILFFKEEKKNHWFFAPLVAAGGISWLLVEQILKPWVARSRPGLEIGAIIVRDGLTDLSFPSGHATIAFAMAVVLSRKEPRWKPLFFILAILIAGSRIFLGKHYPLDVVAGAVIGFCIGHLSQIVCYRVLKPALPAGGHGNKSPRV